MSKIGKIEIFPMKYTPKKGPYGGSRVLAHARVATLVKVTTTEEVVGWGECFGPPLVVTSYLEEMAPYYLGEPIAEKERIFLEILQKWYHQSTGGLHVAALSGLDIALWDAHARTLGVSVAELLGGHQRISFPCYASTGYLNQTQDVDEFRSEIASAIDEGFNGIKIKVGSGLKSDRIRTEIARSELGQEGLLMLDYNSNYTSSRIKSSFELVKEFRPHWIEEPVATHDNHGWEELRHLGVQIAAGEALHTRFGFRDAITKGWLDIVQPTVASCGGLTESKVITQMAMTWNVKVSPHCWGTYLALAATLHLMSSVPDYPSGDAGIEEFLIEVDRGENALREGVATNSLSLAGGRIQVPEGPGLGMTINEDFLFANLMIEKPVIIEKI